MLEKLFQFLNEDHIQSDEEIILIERLWKAAQAVKNDPDLEIELRKIGQSLRSVMREIPPVFGSFY